VPGVINGKLALPPIGTRCVCSEFTDSRAYVEPLSFDGDAAAAWQHLGDLIASLPRIEIQERSDTYLRAISRTRLLGFADDLEFRLDEELSVIHVRSASQVGFWDLGANRRRVEEIRDQWNQLTPPEGHRPSDQSDDAE